MSGKIMIVANDLNTVYLLQRFAEMSGFESIRIGFDDQIIEAANKHTPCLILIDDEPWENADNFFHTLQSDKKMSNIPILRYTTLCESSQNTGMANFSDSTIRYIDFQNALQRVGLSIPNKKDNE